MQGLSHLGRRGLIFCAEAVSFLSENNFQVISDHFGKGLN